MISMHDQLKLFIRTMSSTPFVMNDCSYDDHTSPSNFEENLLFNHRSSPTILEKKQSIDCLQQFCIQTSMNDLVLENKLFQLTSENQILRAKIDMLRRIFGQAFFQSIEQSSDGNSTSDQSSSTARPVIFSDC